MEPMMPTSFIPKRPVSTEPVQEPHPNRAVGLLSLLAVVVVIATAVSYAGVYVYEKQLIAQKQKTDALINEARKGIGTEFLTEMKTLSTRIDGVKAVLDKHIVVTPIFAALEQSTLRSVQYKSFGYEFTSDTTTAQQAVKVTLTGTAKSYATIALQSDSFTQNSLIKNPIFSNLTIDDKTNAVNFKLVFTVNPAALSYEAFIANLGKAAEVDQSNTTITSTVQ
jgi:hypothetical protein